MPNKNTIIIKTIAILTLLLTFSAFAEPRQLQQPSPQVAAKQHSVMEDYLLGVLDAVDEYWEEILDTIDAVDEFLESSAKQLDRTKPRFKVFKNGYEISVDTRLQWYIHDLAAKHNYPEDVIYGMILTESSFDTTVAGDSGDSHGLAQIQPYWIESPAVPRLTDNAHRRNLFNPYDNVITLIEIWNYARAAYQIDTSTEQGMKDLLYWHNTGEYIPNVYWEYSELCIQYSKELEPLQ